VSELRDRFDQWWNEVNRRGTFPEDWRHPVFSGYMEGYRAGMEDSGRLQEYLREKNEIIKAYAGPNGMTPEDVAYGLANAILPALTAKATLEDRDRLRAAGLRVLWTYDHADDGTKQRQDFWEAVDELRTALEEKPDA
jgi:hypothetical protein